MWIAQRDGSAGRPGVAAQDGHEQDCVAWVATRPSHVNIDRMIVRPRAQAAQHKVHRVFG